MKKILVLILALAVSLSLCACGSSSTAESTEAEETAAVEAVAEAAEEVEVAKTAVEASDPSEDTKTPGTTEDKVIAEEDGDKGYYSWSAYDYANFSGGICSACVSLINDTPSAIREIYISSRNAGDWGADVLGSRMLYSGDVLNTDLCYDRYDLTFDVKVVDGNGYEYYFMNNYLGELDNWDMNFEFARQGNGMTMYIY